MSLERIDVPWTQEQVEALNRYQCAGWMHPFTCPLCGKDLLATPSGWICPQSDHEYRQNWAHAFMAGPVPSPFDWDRDDLEEQP